MEYDDQIVPLLRQMSQLEKLILSLYIHNRTSFIDGIHLNNDIISNMPYLHTFMFDIVTEHVTIDEKYLPTYDDICRALIQKGYNVDCYIDYQCNGGGRCHIYSLPFTMERINTITTTFLFAGVCLHVRKLCVSDTMRSIKHDFFVQISQVFPLLEDLSVFSMVKQKQRSFKREDEQTVSTIEYSHLVTLDLTMSHIDYAKQFLLNTNTCLPRLCTLAIDHENLVNVTENFTSDKAHVNCANIKYIIFPKVPRILGKNFFVYFPFVVNIN